MCIWVGNLTPNCVMETPKYIRRSRGMQIPLSLRTDSKRRVAGQGFLSKICTLHQLHLHSSGPQPRFLVPSMAWWRIIPLTIMCLIPGQEKTTALYCKCVKCKCCGRNYDTGSKVWFSCWIQRLDWLVDLRKSWILPQEDILTITLIVICLRVIPSASI